MLLFLDTEFTDLVAAPNLISLGLVADNGETFYAELTRTLWYAQASEFVLAEVARQFTGWAEESPRAVVQRLRAWLQRPSIAATPAQLVLDSDYDWRLFSELVRAHGGWPAALVPTPLCFAPWSLDNTLRKVAEQARARYFADHGLREHHALIDAHALRASYRAVAANLGHTGRGHTR